MRAHVWHGRLGAVVLGDTQHRVARYLDAQTRHGWALIRTDELAERLDLERSEAYRITARLRALGLFGIANDRGGVRGGRRWWRTATGHDGRGLDPERHRVAWSRVVGWARRRRDAARERLDHMRRQPGSPTGETSSPAARRACPGGRGQTFAQLMRAAGAGALMDEWRVQT